MIRRKKGKTKKESAGRLQLNIKENFQLIISQAME